METLWGIRNNVFHLTTLLVFVTTVNSHPPPVVPKPQLRPVTVWAGKECDHAVYTKFFFELNKVGNSSLVKFLTEGTFINDEDNIDEEPKRYFDYLEDLCIGIGEDKFVDPFSFDCSNLDGSHTANSFTGEICTCGTEMEQVDPNVRDPKVDPSSYQEIVLYETIGLHRHLRAEGKECVSGLLGHCNESLPIPLKCGRGLECRHLNDQNYGKELVNSKTSAVYGKCRDDTPPGVPVGRSAEIVSNNTAIHITGTPHYNNVIIALLVFSILQLAI